MGIRPGTWNAKTRYASLIVGGAALVLVAASGTVWAQGAKDTPAHHKPVVTATPIKHLVVIFDENISFDHYFGTYPKAANTDGTTFTAAKDTPKINGLTTQAAHEEPERVQPDAAHPVSRH